MKLWALSVVKEHIVKEMNTLVHYTSGLHLPIDKQNWENIMEFSLQALRNCIVQIAPFLYSLIISASTSPNIAPAESGESVDENRLPKSREPEMIAVVAILMMVVSRNMRANIFQKIIGIWLFACSAPVSIYRVLCRIGLSVGYTSVLRSMAILSEHSKSYTQELAAKKLFLIIIDNINRQRKFWRPALGQQDLMLSGTAATLVELQGCTQSDFDPRPVIDAQNRKLRSNLTPEELYDQVDHVHLSSVMALHCLNFLISSCPTLSSLSDYVPNELRTTYAIHRMPDNAKTQTHPLSTSSINEGSAAGCRNVLNDILLRQLKLPEDVVNSILVIVGGDLGTIEKLRALKRLGASCPHGYSSFSWVLPLVQLWHMGWADLARIINTHWGISASADPSSLWFNCSLLGRKVKPGVRPEYYPALALAVDTLEADVLDCWRLLLNTSDLDTYFSSQRTIPSGPELFELAEQLVSRWATGHAHDIAMESNDFWAGPTISSQSNEPESQSGSESDTPLAQTSNKRRSKKTQPASSSQKRRKTAAPPSTTEDFRGDHCLANSILRLRDLLWHFEFNWAVADGDIGRAMKVMSVWLLTFTGSKASKYATELLELACGFLYEFPPELQNALKNNWLCNLSGLPGCWFAMDLMQEHNIRELKTKSQRRDEDFDGSFFQDVVSRNVRWFGRIRSVVNEAVHLQDRSNAHGSAKRQGTAAQLRSVLERERIHCFKPGRTFGWVAKDNLMDGYELLPSKLTRFLRQSLDPSLPLDEDAAPNEPQPLTDAPSDDVEELPMPSMVIAGRFVAGDTPEELQSDEDILNNHAEDLFSM
ncbi:hypothetical protein FRC09_001437 [Ceratobasidium sp. 395]|nr:hypothetical protein FRC09_001437 [Ceratobasidium sp. 395]